MKIRKRLAALLRVLSVKGQQGGTVSAMIVLGILSTEIGCIAAIALMWSYFGTLMIAVGVVLLVVKGLVLAPAAHMIGTAFFGKEIQRRFHSDIRGDV
jgi:hypothetical protein